MTLNLSTFAYRSTNTKTNYEEEEKCHGSRVKCAVSRDRCQVNLSPENPFILAKKKIK